MLSKYLFRYYVKWLIVKYLLAMSKIVMKLKALRTTGEERLFIIEDGSNQIGRWDPDSGCFPEIDLENLDVESKISRRHAEIIRDGTSVIIRDLGSLNGTFINRGSRLKLDEKVELKSGDEIIVGKTFLRFEVEITS